MPICGCGDRCTCSLVSGNTNLVITGGGDVGDPFVLTVANSPTFSAVNDDGIIGIVPAGVLGHSPSFNISGSPGSDYVIAGDGTGGGHWVPVAPSVVGGGGVYVGMVFDWALSAAQVPSMYLACDGSAVNSVLNPLLHAALIAAGSPYGTSGPDPLLPDTADRASFGLGVTAPTNALGNAGGLGPSHTHTGPSHSHGSGTLSGSTDADSTGGGPNNTSLHAGIGALEEGCIVDAIQAVGGACAGIAGITLVNAPDSSHVHTHDHTVSISAGTTAAAGTGATSATAVGYITFNKIIFAGE